MAAMEELSPFQGALVARRDRYNAQFRLARTLDAQGFLAHLRDAVGPVVDASGGEPVPVTDALVELSVALASRRQPDGFWPLLRSLSRFVGMEPRRVPVSLANALHHLGASPTGRPASWIDTVVTLAGQLDDVAELLEAGAVAAWRCGLAQLRGSAVESAGKLRPEVLRVALGVESTVDFERLAGDPWFDPGSASSPVALRVVRRVGEFRGFGGVFARPPLVSTSDGRWYAVDGEDVWQVFADRFGVGYRRIASLPDPDGGSGGITLAAGRVTDEATGQVLDVPELAEASSWASSNETLAATTPWTHGIVFVARAADP